MTLLSCPTDYYRAFSGPGPWRVLVYRDDDYMSVLVPPQALPLSHVVVSPVERGRGLAHNLWGVLNSEGTSWRAFSKDQGIMGFIAFGHQIRADIGALPTFSLRVARLFLHMAYFNLLLGLANLAPLPPLDGGYTLLTLIEAVFKRRPMERPWVKRVSRAFLFLSILLSFLLAAWGDLRILFNPMR